MDGGEVVPVSGGHFYSLAERVSGWVDGGFLWLACIELVDWIGRYDSLHSIYCTS